MFVVKKLSILICLIFSLTLFAQESSPDAVPDQRAINNSGRSPAVEPMLEIPLDKNAVVNAQELALKEMAHDFSGTNDKKIVTETNFKLGNFLLIGVLVLLCAFAGSEFLTRKDDFAKKRTFMEVYTEKNVEVAQAEIKEFPKKKSSKKKMPKAS